MPISAYDQYALYAQDLVKSYGGLAAVRGVSFHVAPGECFALLGPNGAGKTTTCEMLEGLLTAEQGAIHIGGMSYTKNRQEILQRIGVQLQETRLYKKYTVKETLKLFASFYSQAVNIDLLLARLMLSDKKDTRLEALSGGQKQRVYLGCSLVNNPELIFLDEPTSGLDPQARRHIWDLLKELKKEKRSIFLTTHHMEEAKELADRIAIMDHGRIIAQGRLSELIESFCPEDHLVFSTSIADKEALSQALEWLHPRETQEGLYEASVANASQRTLEFMRVVDQKHIRLTYFSIRQSSLEDVFLKLTGRSIRDD